MRLLAIALLALVLHGCSGARDAGERREIAEGRSMYDQSRFDEAERHFQGVLLRADTLGDAVLRAQALKWLGNVQLAYSRDDEATILYRRASAILDTVIARTVATGGTPETVALDERQNVLNNLAVVHLNRGEWATADSLYTGILAYDNARGDRMRVAVTLDNIGIMHSRAAEASFARGDREGFRQQLLTGRAFFHRSLATYATADAHLNLGNTYAQDGMLDSALASYRTAGALYERLGYRIQQALCLGNIGAIQTKRDDGTDAATALQRAIAIIEELRGNLSSIDVRSSFVSNKYHLYENLIGLLVDQGSLGDAFLYAERAKARSFLDLLGNKAIGESKKRPPGVAALVAEEKVLQDRMTALMGRADSLDRLNALLERHRDVLDALQRLDPEYASLKSIEPLTVRELQQQLPDSTGLVEYFLGENASFVFLIRRDTLIVRTLKIDRTFGLESRIDQIRKKLYSAFPSARTAFLSERRLKDGMTPEQARQAWRASVTDASWQFDLVSMYSILIAPIAERLTDLRRLYIVPHGPLHHLPFQALVAPTNLDRTKNAHIPRPRYLVEDFAIAYLPSASVLKFAGERQVDSTERGLIIGDPVYADPVYRKKPLEGALIEADSVAKFFSTARVLKREAATEEEVKDVIGRSEFVHLATHGELNKRDPLKSRILLAAMQKSGTNDGNLTVAEVFNLDLHATLVTLSACQTAQVAGEEGKFTPGDDLVGLTRSFLYAGTPSVIASLWFVDDAATLFWMTRFYDSWSATRMGKAEAARAAALAMLHAPRDPDWILPYFWGAFIYFGSMDGGGEPAGR